MTTKPAPKLMSEDSFTIEDVLESFSSMRQFIPTAGRIVFYYDEEDLMQFLFGN